MISERFLHLLLSSIKTFLVRCVSHLIFNLFSPRPQQWGHRRRRRRSSSSKSRRSGILVVRQRWHTFQASSALDFRGSMKAVVVAAAAWLTDLLTDWLTDWLAKWANFPPLAPSNHFTFFLAPTTTTTTTSKRRLNPSNVLSLSLFKLSALFFLLFPPWN